MGDVKAGPGLVLNRLSRGSRYLGRTTLGFWCGLRAVDRWWQVGGGGHANSGSGGSTKSQFLMRRARKRLLWAALVCVING